MPEGCELRISCEKIKPIIQGKQIVNVVMGKSSRFAKNPIANWQEILSIVEDINVKGKLMYWKLSNGHYMLNTYGMTGQWSQTETKHSAVSLYYTDPNFTSIEEMTAKCQYLHFNDPRHFGTIKIVNQQQLDEKLSSLGWDPLSENLNIDWVVKKTNKNKPIGQILMDQKVFCGVGNYIRAEALYRAKINPWRFGKELSKEQIEELCQHIIDVMQESYRLQGASFLTYANVDEERGKYSGFFKVYAQKTDPNGYSIIREEMGDRTIHWCPEVQV
jgi:formamidopyrimidine-DNA glycosylase